MTNKDQIYLNKHQSGEKFTFNDDVAGVFTDMISRSVPGYGQLLSLLPTVVRRFHNVDGNFFDLGCSLGASMLAMAEGLQDNKRIIIGIDNSEAMLTRADPVLAKYAIRNTLNYQLHCADLLEYELSNAAIVSMNFTLQFIPLQQRGRLLQKIHTALNDGGVLILSEKIKFDDPATNQLLIDIHHQYKADQGYSQLEIARKRDAIENVLIPETLAAHTTRLRHAGFTTVTAWLQNMQFVSLLAIK